MRARSWVNLTTSAQTGIPLLPPLISDSYEAISITLMFYLLKTYMRVRGEIYLSKYEFEYLPTYPIQFI